ncbi:MAG: hypothetical protein ABIP53_00615 [Candidatus Limnocylindrales bacterium]
MRAFLVVLAGATLVACGAVPGPTQPIPTVTPTQNPSPAPPTPLPTDAPAAFYLRATYSQALPPQFTFNWLPALAIVDGTVIDGNVAVPAIFPGPLVIVPNSRPISEAGIEAIVHLARDLGLLEGETDFTGGGAIPGSRLGQLVLRVDGQTFELTGNPEATVSCGAQLCADPGTPEAFAAFWRQLSNLDSWIGGEVGQIVQYQPERVAVLFTEPAPPDSDLPQQIVPWPLGGSFDTIGVEFPGVANGRCRTISGDDLEATWPALVSGHQLTIFTDADDLTRSALVAVLVPEQQSPCADVS